MNDKEIVRLMAERVETWKRWLETHRTNMEEADNDYDGGYNAGLKVFLEDEIERWELWTKGIPVEDK